MDGLPRYFLVGSDEGFEEARMSHSVECVLVRANKIPVVNRKKMVLREATVRVIQLRAALQ